MPPSSSSRQALVDFATNPSRYFLTLAQNDDVRDELADLSLRYFPFLNEGFDSPAQFEGYDTIGMFRDMAYTFDRWLHGLDDYCDGLTPTDNRDFLAFLRERFPGVAHEINAIAKRSAIRLPHPAATNNIWRRQLMIFVTGECNLRCPYCFSNEMEVKHLSEENLSRVVDWCEGQDIRTLTLCGGEPLMYPGLTRLLNHAAERDMDIYFATNFTVPILEVMPIHHLKGVISSLTIHLTDALWHNARLRANFCDNTKVCRESGVRLTARANLERPDTKWERWLDLMTELRLTHLNVAVTIPSKGRTNHWNEVVEFRDYMPVLSDMFTACHQRGIKLEIAKPYPLCYFPEPLANIMMSYPGFQPLCMIHKDSYLRDLCIYPDMHMAPCLSVDTPTLHFRDNLEWGEIVDVFAPHVRQLLHSPLFDRCKTCFLYQRRLCQGACLAYKSPIHQPSAS